MANPARREQGRTPHLSVPLRPLISCLSPPGPNPKGSWRTGSSGSGIHGGQPSRAQEWLCRERHIISAQAPWEQSLGWGLGRVVCWGRQVRERERAKQECGVIEV